VTSYQEVQNIVTKNRQFVVIYNNLFTKPALDDSIEHSVDVLEQVKFDYSMKNIPIPSEQEFIIELISSIDKFIKLFM
jgi:hypothetical protein